MWWWSGTQGHTCTWRLFEAATVGKVWRATARERKLAAQSWDWEVMGWDGQKTGGGGLLQLLHALRRRVAVGPGRGREGGRAFVRACVRTAQHMHASSEA